MSAFDADRAVIEIDVTQMKPLGQVFGITLA